MRRKSLLVGLFSIVAAVPCSAYVEMLHVRITGHAFDRVMSETDFMQRYQFAPISNVLRNMMQFGAFHEDDMPRSVNHFFDPQNGNNGLTVPFVIPPFLPICNTVGVSAKDWALHFPLNTHGLDATHQAFYENLTGITQGDRDLAAFSLFEDLGHIVHLVQDMGQPEHTRNDQHLVLYGWGLTGFPVANAASLYENWTRDHIALSNLLPNGAPVDSLFVGFSTPKFGTYDSYFSNGLSGMADYSSANHVTQDTNYKDTRFHCFNHSLPMLGFAIPRVETAIATVVDPDTTLVSYLPIDETIYTYNFSDYVTGQQNTDGFHTIESFINHLTGKYDKNVKVFTLDDESWLTRAANLLPKTVGYSAGVVEWFFRADVCSMWFLQPDGTFNVQLWNYTPTGELLKNCFVELYRTEGGQLVHVTAPGAPAVPPPLPDCTFFQTVATGIPYDPSNPIWKSDLRMVVRATLGNEENAVMADLIPKKQHTIKLVFDYPQNQYRVIGLQALKQGTKECGGGGDGVSKDINGLYSQGVQMPFSDITKPPLNGEITFTVGAMESDVFLVEFSVFSNGSPTATVTVYSDDQQTAQMTLPYATLVQQRDYRLDGAGNLAPWP